MPGETGAPTPSVLMFCPAYTSHMTPSEGSGGMWRLRRTGKRGTQGGQGKGEYLITGPSGKLPHPPSTHCWLVQGAQLISNSSPPLFCVLGSRSLILMCVCVCVCACACACARLCIPCLGIATVQFLFQEGSSEQPACVVN